jgi:rhodanese-related sulfurtransferase
MNILKKLFGGSENPAPSAEPDSAPRRPAEPIRINQISAAELKARLDNGEALTVVDMRQGWEYQSGHIPGAINIFVHDIPARLSELPQDRDIVFQCWHGNTSQNASAFAIENGWDSQRVFSLSGGMAGWASAMGKNSLVKD